MNIENKIKTSIEQEKLENELSHKKYELENLNEEKAKENKQLSKKVGNDNLISKINLTPETATIQASKVNINGAEQTCDILLKSIVEENEELKQQIIIMEKYFELINNISFDYDGYNNVTGLKGVIDELNRFANLGRACNITEPIYDSDGVKFNILLQKLSEQKIGDDK